jgi:hypothetical protein
MAIPDVVEANPLSLAPPSEGNRDRLIVGYRLWCVAVSTQVIEKRINVDLKWTNLWNSFRSGCSGHMSLLIRHDCQIEETTPIMPRPQQSLRLNPAPYALKA